MLWTALRNRQLDGAKFRRQQLIGPFVVDFFCPGQRLIVEVDGPIHETQQEYDEERQRQLEGCGYRVLRVSAAQVEQDLRGTIEIIRDALTPLPPLPREGEGVRG